MEPFAPSSAPPLPTPEAPSSSAPGAAAPSSNRNDPRMHSGGKFVADAAMGSPNRPDDDLIDRLVEAASRSNGSGDCAGALSALQQLHSVLEHKEAAGSAEHNRLVFHLLTRLVARLTVASEVDDLDSVDMELVALDLASACLARLSGPEDHPLKRRWTFFEQPPYSYLDDEVAYIPCGDSDEDAPDVAPLAARGRALTSFIVSDLEFAVSGVGHAVWPGAMLLAEALVMHSLDVRGKDVVELGCGTSPIGPLCILRGARSLLQTDYQTAIVDNARLTVTNAVRDGVLTEEQGARIEVAPLDWAEAPARADLRARADVLLMADCLYLDKHVGLLEAAVNHMMRPGATLVHAWQERGFDATAMWVSGVVPRWRAAGHTVSSCVRQLIKNKIIRTVTVETVQWATLDS